LDINDPRGALRELVDLQQNKVWPENGDWLEHLKALMKDGNLFSEASNHIPLPLALFDRQLDLLAGNESLLKETGLTEQYIAEEKAALLDTGSDKLDNALYHVFHTKTTIVNDLVDPLYCLRPPKSKIMPRVYQSAIVFPCIDGGDQIMRGIVLFLPMEL